MKDYDRAELYQIISFFLLLAFGCTLVDSEYVTPRMWHHAELQCATNRGIRDIELDNRSYDITCNNAAKFTARFMRGEEVSDE